MLMTPGESDFDAVLAGLLQRPAWHARAACRGLGTADFFPARGQPTDAAKVVCGRCEVKSECLAAALELPDARGIWGGLSDYGRRLLLKRGVA
jgi:WhiB family transcriptional regulator, redox-sensing transcriptional regulator